MGGCKQAAVALANYTLCWLFYVPVILVFIYMKAKQLWYVMYAV